MIEKKAFSIFNIIEGTDLTQGFNQPYLLTCIAQAIIGQFHLNPNLEGFTVESVTHPFTKYESGFVHRIHYYQLAIVQTPLDSLGHMPETWKPIIYDVVFYNIGLKGKVLVKFTANIPECHERYYNILAGDSFMAMVSDIQRVIGGKVVPFYNNFAILTKEEFDKAFRDMTMESCGKEDEYIKYQQRYLNQGVYTHRIL